MTTASTRSRTALAIALAVVTTIAIPSARAAGVETVYFPSADGRTELVAYLFRPAGQGPFPVVVMLHGRAGPYSANVNAGCTTVARGTSSPCNGTTLTRRTQAWGEFWIRHGMMALAVDSFGPRGRGHGYGRNTHDDPDRDEVNERTVRPLDADGALAWLRGRPDVRGDRIGLQGWSNGASTTLNVMQRQATGAGKADGFKAALAFYPGCGPRAILDGKRYAAGAPLTVFLASDDEEVNPTICRKVLTDAPAGAGRVDVVWYDGATHDFDDPGKARQSVPGNRTASQDAFQRAELAFTKELSR